MRGPGDGANLRLFLLLRPKKQLIELLSFSFICGRVSFAPYQSHPTAAVGELNRSADCFLTMRWSL